jgi:hypothetical protein
MITAILLLAFSGLLLAQDEVEAEVRAAGDTAEGLDLQAVGALFAEAESLEAFERALNDEETGVNNLDLDDNGQVDFIRVVEEVADQTHLVVLQVCLGDDDYHDVAIIEVERTGDDEVQMQVHGDEELYGPDYYAAPSVVHIHTWPIIVRMYRPGYRPYVSAYRWRHYPRWYKRRVPVAVPVYQKRVVHYHRKPTFVVSRTTRVRTAHKVHYKPRRSARVVKKTTVVKKPGRRVVRKKTVVKPPPRRR